MLRVNRLLKILPLLLITASAHGAAPMREPLAATLFQLAGQPITIVDLMTFGIAAFGITGLLLIRRQLQQL